MADMVIVSIVSAASAGAFWLVDRVFGTVVQESVKERRKAILEKAEKLADNSQSQMASIVEAVEELKRFATNALIERDYYHTQLLKARAELAKTNQKHDRLG